jgi:hypothetical protein
MATVKIGTLVIRVRILISLTVTLLNSFKTLAKPISTRIKNQAREYVLATHAPL